MKRILVFLLAATLLLLSACSLLPPEESIRVAPVIPENESIEFNTTTVERIDMVLSHNIICTYDSQGYERLLFDAEGIAFDRYYVQLGDRVTKGQLLAELDMSDINARLTELRLDLSLLELQVSALEEDRALALERRKILMEGSSAEELAQALAEVNEQYDRRGRSFKDEMYLIDLQIKECEAEIPKRQLRAGIDGVVSYLYDFSQDPTGKKVVNAIRLVDPDQTFFRAETDLWPYLEVGKTFYILAGREICYITVVPAAELGFEEEERVEGADAKVYFQADRIITDLKVGEHSTITVVMETREKTLAIPVKALTTVGGQTMVYYVDEEGMRACKPVETGIIANGMVEILSGLEEGETIISG